MPLASFFSPLALVAFLSSAQAGDDPAGPEPANWRFKDDAKPVKVAVVAGSIGSFPNPFHARLAQVCTNVEVRNLSKTGIGALAMKQRFREQVLSNRRVNPKADDGNEYWLFFASGVNSIGMPKTTNHYLKGLTLLAHINGMKVLALTPTPWGKEGSRKFRGLEGLRRRKATQLVTDFLLGRVDPVVALGEHVSARPAGREGPWDPIELPDITIDVYDSPLRNTDASQRDVDEMRGLLDADAAWQKEHAGLDDTGRAIAREVDAWMAADAPRWFMKPALQAFDHIHPNADGHAIIAGLTCPEVPESWGCDCTQLPLPSDDGE